MQLWNTEHSSIQEAITAKLDREIDVTGMSCPEFLAKHGYINAPIQTAARIQPNLKRLAFAWRYFHIIRLAYNLDNSKLLEHPIGTNFDREDNYLLHFDH